MVLTWFLQYLVAIHKNPILDVHPVLQSVCVYECMSFLSS